MKKVFKFIFATIAFVLVILTAKYSLIFLLFMRVDYFPSSKMDSQQFTEIKQDLDIVVDFLKGYAEKHKNDGRIVLGVGKVDDMELTRNTYNGRRRLKLDENTRESFVAVKKMLDIGSKLYSLDLIVIDDNYIAFMDDTHGRYELVYSINGKRPTRKCSMTDRRFRIVKAEEKWYHRMN